MNIALIKKELREALWKIILGLGIMIATAISIPLLYEMVIDLFSGIMAEEIGFLVNFLPTELLENYSWYVWSQWNAKNLLNVGTFLAVLVGMGMVAGEVSNQTIGFLLSRPVSRRSVIISKLISGALILGIVVGGSTAFLLMLASAFAPEPLEVGRLVVASCITYLGLLLVFTLTLFFSTLLDDSVKVAGVSILVLLGTYLLGWFPQTRPVALFRHISAVNYFIMGESPLALIGILLAITALLAAVSIGNFEKKNF